MNCWSTSTGCNPEDIIFDPNMFPGRHRRCAIHRLGGGDGGRHSADQEKFPQCQDDSRHSATFRSACRMRAGKCSTPSTCTIARKQGSTTRSSIRRSWSVMLPFRKKSAAWRKSCIFNTNDETLAALRRRFTAKEGREEGEDVQSDPGGAAGPLRRGRHERRADSPIWTKRWTNIARWKSSTVR